MSWLLRRCPARFAFLLEHPFRRRLLRVDRLVESLRLAPGARVLDVGAGSGVVSAALASTLERGEIILVDAQWRMLTRARRRLAQCSAPKINFVVAVAEHLPLADASIDVALVVTVLGEVDDPGRMLSELHRVLRPNAVLSISEHLPDPDFRSAVAVRALVRSFGFQERESVGRRWSYTINFVKG